jgi:methyltransferase (TIGR00027 family)
VNTIPAAPFIELHYLGRTWRIGEPAQRVRGAIRDSDNHASSTAIGTALTRAAHTRLDPDPLIDDAWGDRLVPALNRANSRSLAVALLAARGEPAPAMEPQAALDHMLRAAPGYTNIILRTRYTEDLLREAAARGTRQYVILGAGFDSFALRRPRFAEHVVVFEIDRPPTQALKRQGIAEAGLSVPESLHLIAADLAKDDLAAVLARTPYRFDQPGFFAWLGVSMFLTRDTNLASLRAIAGCSAPGSELVFTYFDERIFYLQAEEFRRMQDSVRSVGEPFLCGFDPNRLAEELRQVGFDLLEDLDEAQLVARYSRTGRPFMAPLANSRIAFARRNHRAIALNPRFIGALIDRGNMLLDLARPAEALMTFEKVVELDPGETAGLNGAGNALLEDGRAAEAAGFFTRAVDLRPNEPVFLLNRALAHSCMNRPQDALHDCRRARELGHATAQLHFVEGNALLDLGRAREAIEAFDSALGLDPTLAKAYNNRGTALLGLGAHEAALASFERCLALSGGVGGGSQLMLQARLNRCSTLRELGRRIEALEGLEELAELAPDLDFVRGLRLHEQLAHCEWRDYHASIRVILEAIERGRAADGPFTFLAVSDSPAAQLRCAQLHAAQWSAPPPSHRRGAHPTHNEKFRIAYLSSDLREHATSYLMAGIFEAHDRSRFEIHGISTGLDDHSAMRQRITAGFDRFLDAARMQDAEIYAWIVERSIDVLVDLNGHTSGARRGLLTQRGAPVQVNYLGYPGTIGARYIDYLIADEVVIPRESRRYYIEQIVYLPDCFQPNDDRRIAVTGSTRERALLPPSGFVFCSFNNSYKFNPVMFDIWCRLLRAVPGSVLWTVLNSEAARANLRREARARGVEADRLVFAEQLPYAHHLGRLGLADLFLDTLPFNAGTTASDALWAGLPVLTCLGQAFAARMAGSLLRGVGLPELVTENLADYERLALQLASNPAHLAELRSRLEENRGQLFDTKRHCRNLEAAYAEMSARYRRGEQPASFTVRDPLGEGPP